MIFIYMMFDEMSKYVEQPMNQQDCVMVYNCFYVNFSSFADAATSSFFAVEQCIVLCNHSNKKKKSLHMNVINDLKWKSFWFGCA